MPVSDSMKFLHCAQSTPNPSQHYQRGQVQRFFCTQACRLQCQRGEFWITINDVTTDFILHPGMGIRLFPGQICVIEACTEGVLQQQAFHYTPSNRRRVVPLLAPAIVLVLVHRLMMSLRSWLNKHGLVLLNRKTLKP